MADSSIPYIPAYGNVTKALKGIQTASKPDKFTVDFLETKLGMKGGSARPTIPFLKKTGFLASDGTPTDLYSRFRNQSLAGAAAADAMKIGFVALYAINEYAHDLPDPDLRGIVIQATGAEEGSTQVKAIVGSFKALRAFADFDSKATTEIPAEDEPVAPAAKPARRPERTLALGYTINLNLPATSDVAVYNAIFRSLREHILDE